MANKHFSYFRRHKILSGFLILFLVLIVWYLNYFYGDYRDQFVADKGEIVDIQHEFVKQDSLFKNYNLKIIDSNNLTINGYVRMPIDSSQRYAGLLVMDGIDTGKDVISLFESTEKAILVSFDYPYDGPRKFKGSDIGPFLPKIRGAIIRSVSVVLTIIDYLSQRKDVDPEKIFVVGASFGAPFAVNAAAVDPRIKAVILLYGGGNIGKMIESSSKQYADVLGRKALGWLVASLLAPVEPMKYVEYISPRPLLMINGRHDESIFEESAKFLFDQAKEPKELIWLETKHAKPKMNELTHQLEIMMKEWLQRKGLL